MESIMKNIKTIFKSALAISFGLLMITSCETDYIPSTNLSDQVIVVEGYIESGAESNPTYVILTKSIPFVSTIDPSNFAELFIKGASVSVNDGDKDVTLNELCISQLPEEFKKEVYRFLGFNPDSSSVDVCIYVDLLDQLKRESGRTYKLNVKVDDLVITSTTSIPEYVPLFNFRWAVPPGKLNDTLAQLNVTIDDPKNQKNYYRYFTASNGNILISPFTSVIDDALFNGDKFEFPLSKADRRGAEFDPDSFGLFKRGDTIQVKWCTIDKPHFDFWQTRDFNANSGGPFSSYTRISTNIIGGQGIWGGYAVDTYEMIVPPK
jgi:hypothetical protein